MPRKSITLYETEREGMYHQHWLAFSHADAAGRAVSHAEELGVTLDRVDVSSMVAPEVQAKGGLVYVVNDTRNYLVRTGRIRRADPPA